MRRVEGKVAVVTGAGSGIGLACARMLAREGASVVVADIDAESAADVAEQIVADGGTAVSFKVDIGEGQAIRDMIGFAVNTYGGLDILHNNAAATRLAASTDSSIEEMDLEVWDKTMQVNLRGAMLGCKYAIPAMRARGGGSIINTSSGSANSGVLSYTAYAVSKAAIEALTRHVAAQHGKENIRCNAISPGFILTDASARKYGGEMLDMMLSHHLTPRLGNPDDIAHCVVYLGSEESGFVTGQVVQVDGGSLSHQPYLADERRAMAALAGGEKHE